MKSSFVSGYSFLWNFEILYFCADLAEIWLRGQILLADSESEVIKPIRAISCNFASEYRQALLNNMVVMETIKVSDKIIHFI